MSPGQQALDISQAARRETSDRPARARRTQDAADRQSGARGAGRPCLPDPSVSRERRRRWRSTAVAEGAPDETAQGPTRKMGSGRAIGSHGESRTRGLPKSSCAGSRAPRLPVGRWDRTAANRTAPSMSQRLSSRAAATSLKAGCGQGRGRRALRGRSRYGRAGCGERLPADAGQVAPTMPRQQLRAPPRNSAAAHHWHGQAGAASLTKARQELA